MFAPPRTDGTIRAKNAVFIQLAEADFTEPSVYEPIFDDLSRVVREAHSQASTTAKVLAHIQHEVGTLKTNKLKRKVVAGLRSGAEAVIIKIPMAVLKSIAEGFGKALGEKWGT
jgi:hypothetical protein